MERKREPEFEEFIRQIPKTETHLHLEGAVPLSVYHKRLPALVSMDTSFLNPGFRYSSFNEFNGNLLSCALPYFVSLERYAEASRAVFAEVQAQGVHYLEVSFHLGLVLALPGVHPREVIDTILGQAPEGLEVRVYAGLLHNDFNGQLGEWIEEASSWENLTGLDLHGPEELPFESWTSRAWAKTKEKGKQNRAHAGEFLGADFVERVVRELQVDRIAHGVRAAENPAVVQLLVDKGITLDVCPISNFRLRVSGVDRIQDHPIRQLYDSGVKVTLSSDDPTFFGNQLIDEYSALHQECGFSLRELVQVAKNGFEAAILPEKRKTDFLMQLDAIADRLPQE